MRPLTNFSTAVCNDGNVFLDKISKKILRGDSVFVVIPVRLGLNAVEPEYLECLKQMFNFESSCGIAGGSDYKALYFTGMLNPMSADPQLMYLDPHFVHDAIPGNRCQHWIDSLARSERATGDHWLLPELFLKEYHCSDIRTMKLSKICPSLAIGFYLRGHHEYESFKSSIERVRKMDDCFFSVF